LFLSKVGRGAHRGEGVFLFEDTEEKELRTFFNDGADCDTKFKDLQM